VYTSPHVYSRPATVHVARIVEYLSQIYLI
jgi:hypothetical protein